MACILIVDDNRFARNMLSRKVTALGHVVHCACDGEDAMELYKQNKDVIELIITDLLMPKMDGLGLLKALRDFGCEVPRVVVSADVQESTQAEAKNLGAVDFIMKPVKPETVTELLTQYAE